MEQEGRMDTIRFNWSLLSDCCKESCYWSSQKLESQNVELTPETQEMPDTLTPDRAYEQDEQLRLVHHLINELPEKQRTIVQLRDIEGKSYKEIADVLQLTEEQVKVNLFRARQRIKLKYSEIDNYGL